MKPLFTDQELLYAHHSDKLPCECIRCGKTFYLTKKRINDTLNPNLRHIHSDYCSIKCARTKSIKVNCASCGSETYKILSEMLKSKSGRYFCSSSCAGTYNNTHKSTGNRRSKLEIYLEERLSNVYPKLDIQYNKKNAINSELDIYIPSLRLAFELNGIFHFEPIFGQTKLTQTQNNDHRKFQACSEKNISLCVIDTSKMKYFKKENADYFVNIITKIINDMAAVTGLEPA